MFSAGQYTFILELPVQVYALPDPGGRGGPGSLRHRAHRRTDDKNYILPLTQQHNYSIVVTTMAAMHQGR